MLLMKKVPAKVAPPAPPAAPPAPKKGGRPRKEKAPPSEAALQYRTMRKWTVPKIEALVSDPSAIYARLGESPEKTLSAAALLRYLQAAEGDMPDWQRRQEKTSTRKAEKAAGHKPARGVAAPPPKVDAKTALAKAASGTAMAPKKPLPPTPPAPAVKKLLLLKKSA
jgi:hypothetical protein